MQQNDNLIALSLDRRFGGFDLSFDPEAQQSALFAVQASCRHHHHCFLRTFGPEQRQQVHIPGYYFHPSAMIYCQ